MWLCIKLSIFGGSENWTCWGGLVESWEKSNRAISRRENVHGKLSDKMKIQLGEKNVCECVSEKHRAWEVAKPGVNLLLLWEILLTFSLFVCLLLLLLLLSLSHNRIHSLTHYMSPFIICCCFEYIFRIFPFSGDDTETLDLRTPTWCNNFSNKIAFYAVVVVVVAALLPSHIFGSLGFFFAIIKTHPTFNLTPSIPPNRQAFPSVA